MPPPPKLSSLASRLVDSGLGQNPAAVATEAADLSPAPAAASKRPKLWELADRYHCPVIGTCIGIEDLIRFARRFKFKASLRDEFGLHSEAVGHTRTRNEVSETLQRHLDRQYEAWVTRFAKLKGDGEVRQLWEACLARGEVAGPFWAVLTHKAVEEETRYGAFAAVHMLSHQVGAGQAADARRLAHLEKENGELKKAAADERRAAEGQLAALRQQVAVLQAQRADEQLLLEEVASLRRRLEQVENGQALVDMGEKLAGMQAENDQLRAAAQRAMELDKTLQASREEASQALRERDRLADERNALERLLLAAAGEGKEECGGDCERCDQPLSQQCILYVGGRTALVNQYKSLAERLGIRLIHHDGGQEEAISRLPELIHSADAVVCPTDCISHNAYYQLKSHCKRSGKPCLFFRGSGVSSFAVAMTRVAKGEFSVAGELPTDKATDKSP